MKKANNWILIGVFGALAVIFVGVRYFRSAQLEGNIPDVLVELDTAALTEIIITPAKKTDMPVRLVKAGKWQLKNGENPWRLEQGAAEGVIRQLARIQPERFVSKKQSRWKEYGVSDSTGTRVKGMSGEKAVIDLWVGTSGFSQTAGRRFGGTGFTYVRLNGGDEVYAIEGFLEPQFNRPFDEWRDKSFLRVKRDSLVRITYRYPADSGFQLQKFNRMWTLGSAIVDSTTVSGYLSGLDFKNMNTFSDQPPSGDPSMSIVFEGKSGVMAQVDAWPTSLRWTLRSSLQPETYFSALPGSVADVWVGSRKFLPAKK